MAYLGNRTDDEIAIPAVITEDIFHYAVHEGIAYHVITYATTGIIYINFTTPNTENYLHLIPDVSGEKNTVLNVYKDCTFQAGGSDKVVNAKNLAAVYGQGASSVLAGQTATAGSVQIGRAPSAVGTLVYDEYNAKGAGGRDAAYEILLEKNTNYSFQVVASGGDADKGLNLTWFEVPIA